MKNGELILDKVFVTGLCNNTQTIISIQRL